MASKDIKSIEKSDHMITDRCFNGDKAATGQPQHRPHRSHQGGHAPKGSGADVVQAAELDRLTSHTPS